jgi:hypothetical protein
MTPRPINSGLRAVLSAWHRLPRHTQEQIVRLCEGDQRKPNENYAYPLTTAAAMENFEAERQRIIATNEPDVPF